MKKSNESRTGVRKMVDASVAVGIAGIAIAATVPSAEALTNNDIKTSPRLVYGALIDGIDKLPVQVTRVGANVRETGSFVSQDGDIITFSYTHPADAQIASTNGVFKAEEFDSQTKKFESGIYLVNQDDAVHIVTVRATSGGNSIITNIDGNESLMPMKQRDEFAQILTGYVDAVQAYNK